MKLAFIAAKTEKARDIHKKLQQRYSQTPPEEADVIIVLGGDGFMLKTLHQFQRLKKPVYGINFGSVGFLMNTPKKTDLLECLAQANETVLHPLKMVALTGAGVSVTAHAINEVSLLRQTAQAAKIRIYVDKIMRLDTLACDGVLIATPAGSTAYNLSAHGPIIPMKANLLALTPISAFRPRRWRGALLPHTAHVTLEILEAGKRPVSVSADGYEVRDIRKVDICQDPQTSYRLLFDPDHNLEDRIIGEQFIVEEPS